MTNVSRFFFVRLYNLNLVTRQLSNSNSLKAYFLLQRRTELLEFVRDDIEKIINYIKEQNKSFKVDDVFNMLMQTQAKQKFIKKNEKLIKRWLRANLVKYLGDKVNVFLRID